MREVRKGASGRYRTASLGWVSRACRARFRPSPRPFRVLDPRRGVPDPGARGPRGRARDAGGGAHRPRLARGRDRPRQGDEEARREADPRLRGLRRRRPQGAAEGLRAPDAPRRDERGLREPDQAQLARLPRGLLLQAARRLGAARPAQRPASSRSPAASRAASARRSRKGAPTTPRASSTGSTTIFGKDSVYVEMQNAHLDVQQRINPLLEQLAAKRALPTVATGDVHYLRHEDARAHEALLCIQSGDSLKNPNHWNFDTDHFYFKTQAEMLARLPRPGGRAAAHARDRRALQRRDRARPHPAAALPDARRPRRRSTTSSSGARRGSRSATTR